MMASNRVMSSGPVDKRWFTLYVHGDAEPTKYRMFETYEEGGYEHYVCSKNINMNKDKPRFKRVVLVSGRGNSHQLIHSYLIWTGESCRLSQIRGEERLSLMDWKCVDNGTTYEKVRVVVISSNPTSRELTTALGFTPVASGGRRPSADPSGSEDRTRPFKEHYSRRTPVPIIDRQNSSISTSSAATTVGASTSGSAVNEPEIGGAKRKPRKRNKNKSSDNPDLNRGGVAVGNHPSTSSSNTVTDMSNSGASLSLGVTGEGSSILPADSSVSAVNGEGSLDRRGDDAISEMREAAKEVRKGLIDKNLKVRDLDFVIMGKATLKFSDFDRVDFIPSELSPGGSIHGIDDEGIVYVVKLSSSVSKAKTDGKSFILALV